MRSGSRPDSPQGPTEALIAGRYELLRPLAKGGMGEVFLARDLATGDSVALKRVKDGQLKRPKALAHFRAEYHALSRLKHPRIIQVRDFGIFDGVPYYTMELLDGKDLRDVGPVHYREACSYLRDVASSLALLHAQRLLHRDLSPRNVRRTEDGRCKLLDFGAMAPFGVPPNVAGTAPFVPPEAAECAFLDQRADLYSLGALAYWLLSGEHAYPASKLDDLPKLWPIPIERLRSRVPDVPESLDALVMSLLELDALKRPPNAADVIEQLNAIAELEPESSVEVAQSYLTSAELHGRDNELTTLRALLERSIRGLGGAVLVEGATGIGRSRLLNEVSVLAQTRGVLTLRGFGASEQGGQLLARELRRALERSVPGTEGGLRVQPPSSELEVSLSGQGGGAENMSGFEERAREQVRLAESFLRVARERPLLLVVDDLDLADEFSASLVASLAHQTSALNMLVVASVNTDRKPAAERALASFREQSELLRLGPLDAAAVREMVSGLLGEVPNLERLVDWLDRGARGNPGLTMELTQLLVNRGQLRYLEGTWVLPEGEITERMPQGLAETLALRLEGLSPMARSLAEIVALMARDVPLDLCMQISGSASEETLSALDELVAAGVFVGASAGFAFAQGALRDAVQQTMSEARKKAIHRQLSTVLLSLPPTLERRLEAGAHLVRTDDELRGADLLAEVGPELARQGKAWGTVIPAMERALEVYERLGAPSKKSLPLRQVLVLAGYLFDYRLALKYGEDTITKLASLSGLHWARKVRRFLGTRIAVWLCLLLAIVRRPFTSETRRAPSPYQSLVLFGRCVMGLMGVRATALDRAGAQWVLDQIAPGEGMNGTALPAAHLACKAFAMQPLGREGELSLAFEEALRALRAPLVGVTEPDRLDLRVGLMLASAINESFRIGSEALKRADEIEALGTRLAHASAQRIRMTYYLVRGDRERTEHYRRLIDLHGIQGGTTWQIEWFAVPIEGMADTRYGDLVGTRRALSRLEVLAAELPSLSPLRDMVRIGYHARRGDHDVAINLGERFLEAYPPRSVIGWGNAYADIAGAYNNAGQYARAKEICDRALAATSEADREYIVMYAPLQYELAIALAGLGREQDAKDLFRYWRARMDEAGELAPLVLLEAGQVQMASLLSDKRWLRNALLELRESAERSRCASLIAFAARVAQAHIRKTRTSYPAPSIDSIGELEGNDVSTALEGGGNPRLRLRSMLSELRVISGATCAYVFVEGNESPEAVSGDGALPEDLRRAVHQFMTARPASGIAPVGTQAAPTLQTLETQVEEHGFVLKLLSADNDGPRALVVLERPMVAVTEYEGLFTELAEVLPVERDLTLVD
ncbi:MAG: protein kinase [Myxococcales bacterium]